MFQMDTFGLSKWKNPGLMYVEMLKPGTATTFQECADIVFVSYMSTQLATAQSVDIVWDV